MVFVRVEKRNIGGHGPHIPTVTMGAYLADGKMHKSKSVALRLSRSLIEQLGWEPVDRVLYIVINEGSDKDAGFLQLVPDPAGRRTTIGEGPNQGLAINVTIESFKHYILNECPVPSSPVVHTIDGNALIIECPDWLRYNPQSVPAPVTQLHPGRGRRRTR